MSGCALMYGAGACTRARDWCLFATCSVCRLAQRPSSRGRLESELYSTVRVCVCVCVWERVQFPLTRCLHDYMQGRSTETKRMEKSTRHKTQAQAPARGGHVLAQRHRCRDQCHIVIHICHIIIHICHIILAQRHRCRDQDQRFRHIQTPPVIVWSLDSNPKVAGSERRRFRSKAKSYEGKQRRLSF